MFKILPKRIGSLFTEKLHTIKHGIVYIGILSYYKQHENIDRVEPVSSLKLDNSKFYVE